MSIFVFDLVRRQQSFLKKQDEAQAIGLGESLAANSAPYIIINDIDALQKLVQGHKDFPHLNYSMILSPDKIVLAHTDLTYIGTKPSDSVSLSLKELPQTQTLIKNNYVLDVAVPVLGNNKEIIGWVRVGLQQEYIYDNLIALSRNGLLYILIAILIGSFLAFVLGSQLVKGLYKLISTADRIKSGDRNIRADALRSYEVSRLGTAFNQMLDEMSASEDRHRSLVENIGDAIVLLNENAEIIYQSSSVERTLGYTPEEVKNKKVFDFVHPDHTKSVLQIFQHSVASPDLPIPESFQMRHKNGQYIWIEGVIANLLHNQNVNGFIVNFRDITERKKAETDILLEKIFSDTIILGLPGLFYIADKNGKMIRWNKNIETVTGYDYSEINAMHTNDFTDTEIEFILSKREEAFSKGKASAEINIITKQKQKLIYYITIMPILFNEEECVLGMGIDVSEKKKAEVDLKKINHDIGERVKELKCLYRMSELSNNPAKTMEDILQECVDIIPPSYQYPDVTCARILFGGTKYESPNFTETDWKQEAGINAADSNFGKVEVYYTQKMPDEQEGPFLKEERLLINSIADILGSSAERKNAEAVIKEQAETFLAIIENTKESILLISPKYKLLQFNKTAKERAFRGLGKELYIGADFREFLYLEPRDIFYSMFGDALRGNHRNEEIRARGIQDNYFWIQLKTSPVYGPTGELIGVALLSEGIDDRKRGEAELRESEEKFRSLVEQNLVGVYILQDGKLKYVNPGFERAIGYTKDELLNKISFESLIHEEDQEMVKKNYLLRVSGENLSHQYIFKAIKRDGSLLYLEVIASTIIYEGKPAVIGTLVDITDRVEEEKRIGKAVNEAQENERMQIGMELHDNVKQILAASLMSLDHVKSHLSDKKIATETLDNLKIYTKEAIHELRRLSHQLAPSIDTENTLAEKIRKLVGTMNSGEKLKVSIEVDGFNSPLNSDIQIAIYRILQEQFNNIVKYAKASTVLISIKLYEKSIRMIIKDNGNGFDTTTKKDGIGLENIKRRANVLDGQVKIISSPGKGCEVDVQIPLL